MSFQKLWRIDLIDFDKISKELALKIKKFDNHFPSGVCSQKILSVEDIIRTCYQNPNRRKFAVSRIQSWGYKLIPEGQDHTCAESILEIIQKNVPRQILEFDQKCISIYDTSSFRSIDKTRWLNELKTLKWYGPFTGGDPNEFMFQTATDSGNFQGFWLLVGAHNRLSFGYLDESSASLGANYHIY